MVWRLAGSEWRPIYRQGEPCRIFCHARMNSIGVEFEDGFRVCCSKWAVRPRTAKDDEQPTIDFGD